VTACPAGGRALEAGIAGFTVLGIAGEAHRLTDDEAPR
jgi:dihydrodipicolinate synthase/N-acetylneuraminate lyase